MKTHHFVFIVLVLSGVAARAQDPRAFTLAFPEEWISLVVKNAVHDQQVKILGADHRIPIDDLAITFEPGRKLTFMLRTDIETARELAKSESGAVAKALSKFLERASSDYYLKFRFSGRLSVAPPAALVITFDQSDIALELHRGDTRVATAPAPLERLGLWLLDRHLRTIPVAESLEIDTELNWIWRDHWLSSKGHKIEAKFLFAKFPFPPFTLQDAGLSTEEHAIRLPGRRD